MPRSAVTPCHFSEQSGVSALPWQVLFGRGGQQRAQPGSGMERVGSSMSSDDVDSPSTLPGVSDDAQLADPNTPNTITSSRLSLRPAQRWPLRPAHRSPPLSGRGAKPRRAALQAATVARRAASEQGREARRRGCRPSHTTTSVGTPDSCYSVPSTSATGSRRPDPGRRCAQPRAFSRLCRLGWTLNLPWFVVTCEQSFSG